MLILGAALAYLLGSLPSALLVGRLAGRIDIREHGSGNMGATNAFRVLGWRWGLVVGLFDLAKGYLPVLLLPALFDPTGNYDPLYLELGYGLCAIIGHIFTVFARFRGGKGVLTGLGVLLAIAPLEAGITILVFVAVFLVTRIVSLGSLLATAALCGVLFFERYAMQLAVRLELILTCLLLLIIVLVTHRSNIKRLLKGTEPTFKKPKG